MRARGFSLVEFMVAMTIGLFLVAGLVYLIAETSRSRAELERSSRQIENGRYAFDRVAEDLRHAGFWSEYSEPPAPGDAGFPATLTVADACATAIADLPKGLPLAVQGYDGFDAGASSPLACIDDDDYLPNTDVLVIRRASTSTKAVSALVAADANQPFIQTTPQAYKLDTGTNTATFTLTHPTLNNTATVVAPLHRYIVRIYFVSKCNVPASGAICNGTSDDGGTPIPTLKMLELGAGSGAPQLQKLALAEGIEHFQIDYGIDDSGDGVADRFWMCDATETCTTTDWGNVVSAQISIVARNTERSPGHTDTKLYNLGRKGFTAAMGDPYRRHAYTALVRLNNVSMRREK